MKSSVWLITNVICVFVPILMREVSVIDKRYSNTNSLQSVPLSVHRDQPATSTNNFSHNWSLKSCRMFVIGLGGIINLFLYVSDIDNSPRIQDIKKVIGCIFVIFFPILCFYLVPGSQTPVPKEMIDWWTVGLRYRNVQLHIYIQPADLELIINRQWRTSKLFSTLGIFF